MIKIKNLNHKYNGRDKSALKNINLHIKKGENLAIIGSSGSGKSTFLKCINRLIEPSAGEVLINDKDILSCPIKKANLIRSKIGMIFQNFNLIKRETVLKNVLNGRLSYNSTFNTLLGRFSKEDYSIARENIKKVGLEEFENEKVVNLSGGQKQRVAIARALSQEPEIILADEPVSSLDPRLMKEIMDLLKNLCVSNGITLIVSLHLLNLAKIYATRIIGMKNGEIAFDGTSQELTEKNVLALYGKTIEEDLPFKKAS